MSALSAFVSPPMVIVAAMLNLFEFRAKWINSYTWNHADVPMLHTACVPSLNS